MNEKQYKTLCKACDELLLAPDSSIERVATTWLNVIRAHPIFLKNYNEVFDLPRLTSWKLRARNILSAIHHLLKALISSGKMWSCIGKLPQQCDILIVSHLLNENFLDKEEDFYYGGAPSNLARQGISSTIVLINYTGKSPAKIAAKSRELKTPRVILSSVLNFIAECSLYRRVYAESFRLKAKAATQESEFNRRVTNRASHEVASGGTVSALRLGKQIEALVRHLKPRALLVTYEGHSWERIAFEAARSVSPQIVCIGYQHAALFNLQHALQRQLSNPYNPDAILTSGFVARDRLMKSHELSEIFIECMGSNRSFERSSIAGWRNPRIDRKVCLVLPEGIFTECNLLFGFSINCAQLMPEMDFIWRLHPNMDYDSLTRQEPTFLKLPKNIILSTNSLDQDIACSHFSLYRGSTAVVQATVSGVQPVYLHRIGEIPIDTLYEISEFHEQVIQPSDFKALVKNAVKADSNAKFVKDYCENMFTPMDITSLINCVNGST